VAQSSHPFKQRLAIVVAVFPLARTLASQVFVAGLYRPEFGHGLGLGFAQ
jgi:hypothetical protein